MVELNYRCARLIGLADRNVISYVSKAVNMDLSKGAPENETVYDKSLGNIITNSECVMESSCKQIVPRRYSAGYLWKFARGCAAPCATGQLKLATTQRLNYVQVVSTRSTERRLYRNGLPVPM